MTGHMLTRQSSRDDHRDRGDRSDRGDRGGDRRRRRSRSPRHGGGSRRDYEVDTYSSSRDYREREREDTYARRERRDDRGERGERGGDRGGWGDSYSRRDRPRGDRDRDDDRGHRRERGDRNDFRRDRRRDESSEDETGLPAFLTNPVRQSMTVDGEEGDVPAASDSEVNGNGDYQTRRRRRRPRQDEAGGTEGPDFTSEGVDIPPAE